MSDYAPVKFVAVWKGKPFWQLRIFCATMCGCLCDRVRTCAVHVLSILSDGASVQKIGHAFARDILCVTVSDHVRLCPTVCVRFRPCATMVQPCTSVFDCVLPCSAARMAYRAVWPWHHDEPALYIMQSQC